MFYRFECGVFVEADTYEEAQKKLVDEIMGEKEEDERWHTCTCLGLSHRLDCPEYEIPY